jgi:hypothetical protein
VFEMMNQQALTVGAERRLELAIEAMRDARRANGAARHAAGPARVGIGQQFAGEMPAKRAAQPEGDCV